MFRYSITKAGTVKVKASKESACGSTRSGKDFEYKVTVRVDNLDNRGFVVEHIDITDEINKFFKENIITASCEQVATIIARLASKVTGRTSYITVDLTGFATIHAEGYSYDLPNAGEWAVPIKKPNRKAEGRVNKPEEVTRRYSSC